jgi:hypothetical protein
VIEVGPGAGEPAGASSPRPAGAAARANGQPHRALPARFLSGEGVD